MRVAVLAPATIEGPGVGESGPLRVIRSLCTALARLPEIEVVALRVRRTPCDTVIRSVGAFELIQCWIGNVARVLDSCRPQVLQTFSSTATSLTGLYVGRAAKKRGALWVDTVLGLVRIERHLGYVHQPQSTLLETVRLREADVLVVPSRLGFEIVEKDMQSVASAKVRIIPFGIDSSWLEAGSTVRRDPGGGHNLEIVSVGGLAPIKGQDVLLHSFADADVRGRLRLVGPELDHRFARALRALANEMGPGKQVEFLGLLAPQRTMDLVLGSSVFALLSRFDLFPSAVTEAMATAHAPIVTRSVGSADLIEDGQSGYLVDSGDSSSVSLVLESIAADMGTHLERGERARARATTLKWPSIASRYAELYSEHGRKSV